MDWFVRRFIGASLGWLGFGVVLGVTMMFVPHAIAHALWGSMYVLRGGALLMAAGVFLFIYNIRRTMDAREVPVLTINRKKDTA